jgi:hypothetical protein
LQYNDVELAGLREVKIRDRYHGGDAIPEGNP